MKYVTVKDFGDALGVKGVTVRQRIGRGKLIKSENGLINVEDVTNYAYVVGINGGDLSVFEKYYKQVGNGTNVIKKYNKTSKNKEKVIIYENSTKSGNYTGVKTRQKSVEIAEKVENEKLSKINGSVNIAPSQNKTKICAECGEDYSLSVSNRSLKYCSDKCKKSVRSKVNKNTKNKRKERILDGDIDFIANEIYLKYKQKSPSRNLEFQLSLDFFKKHVYADCYYCGEQLEKVGFDRKNNEIGYIESNCVPCCHTCNMMKRSMSFEEFVSKCSLVHNTFIEETYDVGRDVTQSDSYLPKETASERLEKKRAEKHRNTFQELELRKKEADVLFVERQSELKQIQLEKIAGNTLPLDITTNLLKINLQQIFKTFSIELENLATISVETLGGTRADLVRITNAQNAMLKKIVETAKVNANQEIEIYLQEYTETRGKGERKS
jgi:hypothetical protein